MVEVVGHPKFWKFIELIPHFESNLLLWLKAVPWYKLKYILSHEVNLKIVDLLLSSGIPEKISRVENLIIEYVGWKKCK